MAKIGLAIGFAVLGAFTAGAAMFALGAVYTGGFGTALAAGASLGFSAGSMLGSALFPGHPVNQYGPRLDDLLVSTSSPGAGIPICYGTSRYAAQIIWALPLRESATSVTQQSKDGGVTQTTYTYSASFAASFGEGPADIVAIWGDAKVLYSNSAIVPTNDSIPAYDSNSAYSQGAFVSYQGKNYQAIKDVIVGIAPDNFPFGPQFWALWTGPTTSSSINTFTTPHIYPGTIDQPIDSIISTSNGDSLPNNRLTPAYRNQVYAAWQDLELKNFGNRLPNIVGLIKSRLPNTIDYVITDICKRSNVANNWMDFSKLATSSDGTPNTVWGYVISRPTDGRTAISQLASGHFFDVYESDFLLQGRRRDDDTLIAVTIPEEQLGLKNDHAELTETLMQNQELPIEVDVGYLDPEQNYQRNSQLKRRHARTVRTRNKTVIELPLAMTSIQALRVAEKYLYLAWLERNGFMVNCWNPYYMVLDPTDVIQFVYQGTTYKARVLRDAVGQNYTTTFQLVEHEGAAYVSLAYGGTSSGLLTTALQTPPDSQLL